MPVLSTGALTLLDWAKRLDPDGKVPVIVELLEQTNEILQDMRWIEGNLPTGHRTTVRTGLPTVFWRMLNQGVPPSKSTTAQIDEQAGMLEAWSEVDKDLAMLNGNTDAFRFSEAQAFLEAMNQEMASTLFYGNAGIAPEEFTGLSPRYSSTTAGNGQNVILGGGAGPDSSSIWLIVWGPNTVTGIFPKGSKAGLIHDDYGEETVEATAGMGGSRLRAYRERFQWKAGIALRDWRYAVRIANIDISDLAAGTGSQLPTAITRLQILMAKAVHRIPTLGMGKPVFYANRSVIQALDIQSRADVKDGGGLTYENFDGKRILQFRGIPVRVVDALLENEATVA
jgi:Major capsid protein GP7